MNEKVTVKDGYGVSRVMYMIEALFEYFIQILVTGAYLAKLTTTIGISDSMTAILSAITTLSGLFQLISIYLAHKTPVKRWIIPCQIISQMMFCALYLIPIFGIKRHSGIIFFIVIVFGYGIKSVCAPPKTNWFIPLVEPDKRGAYRSTLTIISVIGGTIFTYVMGIVVDNFSNSGNNRGLFITISIIIFVLVILNNVPLMLSKEKPTVIEKGKSPLSSVKQVLKNKGYTRALLCFTLFAIASGLTTPFLGTYQIKELGFSMTFIAELGIAINILWVISLYICGRISRRLSNQAMMISAYAFSIFDYLSVVFLHPSTAILLFISHRTFQTIYSSFNAIGYNNILFDLMKSSDERICALSLSTIMTGSFGFVTTLAATPLVNYIQANPIFIGDTQIYAQQLLATVSFILITVVFIIWTVSYKTVLSPRVQMEAMAYEAEHKDSKL